MPDGWFYVLPEIDVKKLEKLFRHKVFKMLIREKKINRELVDKLLSWKNSGFNIHNQVKIQTHDSHHRGRCFLIFFSVSPTVSTLSHRPRAVRPRCAAR